MGSIKKRCVVFCQHFFGMCNTGVLQEFLRACSGPIAKEPLKMKWAYVYLFGHFVQIWLFLKICSDIIQSFCYTIIIDLFLCFHFYKFYTANFDSIPLS